MIVFFAIPLISLCYTNCSLLFSPQNTYYKIRLVFDVIKLFLRYLVQSDAIETIPIIIKFGLQHNTFLCFKLLLTYFLLLTQHPQVITAKLGRFKTLLCHLRVQFYLKIRYIKYKMRLKIFKYNFNLKQKVFESTFEDESCNKLRGRY